MYQCIQAFSLESKAHSHIGKNTHANKSICLGQQCIGLFIFVVMTKHSAFLSVAFLREYKGVNFTNDNRPIGWQSKACKTKRTSPSSSAIASL